MKRIAAILLVSLVALGTPCVRASESPDAKLNPASGAIEIVDPVWTGDNYDIRFVVAGGDPADAVDVTSHPADDLRPRLAIAPGGDSYVVWWRDGSTPQVLVRARIQADETWSEERVLSGADLPSRDPEIVHDGNDAWVAFGENPSSGGTIIRVGAIIHVGAIEDTPDPFGVSFEIGSTTFGGVLDLQIHAASGHLWVTWTDSDSDVAWSEYDHASETWNLVDYDSYTYDSTKHALERIRAAVLGN